MSEKNNSDLINEIIREVIIIEKKALFGNEKAKHTQRRGKVQSVIEQYFKKISENK